MIGIIKITALLLLVAAAVLANPMSEVNKKEVQSFVSHSEAAVLPMHHISMSFLDGTQNDGEAAPDADTATTAKPSATTTSAPNSTTTAGSSLVKPSNSVATVLLFSMLTVVTGVFFGLC